jgi:methyl-accepting chemotaxis protein
MAAGDLSVKIPLYPGDKRSLLATLVKMQTGLRRIAAHVTASAKQLSDASEHLNGLSASITEGLHKGTQFTVTLPLESILRQTNLRADITQEDVVRNVDRVTRLNEENTVAAQRVSDDAYRLQTLSAELKQIVGGFKL